MHQFPATTDERSTAEGLTIIWQQGPLGAKNFGDPIFNGATIEVVIRAALDRLAYYQRGATACPENNQAIAHLQMALRALDDRTIDRFRRTVIGTEVP